MGTSEIFHADIVLWSGRDLAALEAALESCWKDYGMGLYKKKGFANRAECTISDNGGHISITFESEKYLPRGVPILSNKTVVYIGEE